MKRTVLIFMTLIVLVLPAAFAAAQNQSGTVIVNADVLNVRSEPNLNASIIAKVNQGYTAGTTGKTADSRWFTILIPGGTGWVSADYITVVNAHLVPVISGGTANVVGYINTGALNVRSVPSPTNNVPIATFYRGTTVDIIGRNADSSWLQIVVGYNGVVGWVNGRYIAITSGTINSLPITSGGVTPTPPIGGLIQGTVNTGALNIRTVPRWWGNTPITFIYRSTPVTVIGRNSDSSWYQVRLSDGTVGWARGKYISLTSGSIQSAPITG